MKTGGSRFQPWFDQFWKIAGAVSVRAKITGIILGLVSDPGCKHYPGGKTVLVPGDGT
jgi:hypothetical protein